MRRVPSVSPEELKTLSEKLGKHPGVGVLNHSLDVPLCVRYLEARRGIGHARLLPGFVRKFVFKLAATRPLESELTEMIEEVIAQPVDLQRPTQAVIL